MRRKYTVIIKETAQKQIKRLPIHYLTKVKQVILGLANNPRPHGAIKLHGGDNEYRIRVGVYRILYSIQDDVLIVYVFDVDHRKQVYR
ncbi:MAG: type II toxin-antitoxin system RelE/ParE family toxin [Sphingobacteriales bacterium]|nr:type II toxin-antitoxin system RelE/ParE family toxin [Sphingobacteriales bacterium]